MTKSLTEWLPKWIFWQGCTPLHTSLVWILHRNRVIQVSRKCYIRFPICAVASRTKISSAWKHHCTCIMDFTSFWQLSLFLWKRFLLKMFYLHQRTMSLHFQCHGFIYLKVYIKPVFLFKISVWEGKFLFVGKCLVNGQYSLVTTQ